MATQLVLGLAKALIFQRRTRAFIVVARNALSGDLSKIDMEVYPLKNFQFTKGKDNHWSLYDPRKNSIPKWADSQLKEVGEAEAFGKYLVNFYELEPGAKGFVTGFLESWGEPLGPEDECVLGGYTVTGVILR